MYGQKGLVLIPFHVWDLQSQLLLIVCRYRGSVYDLGEEVPTEEPCLLCECKSAVVCKLRICPEIPVPPPPGCIVVHKARKCCATLICNQHMHETNRKFSREQKLPAVNSSLSSTSTEGKGYCVLDGTVYAEGSAMRSSSLCQYCFCIRGEMKCSSPQCVIPMNGCKPKFRSYACCPTNYDCQESNSTAVLKTTPSSTPVPEFLKGCLVKGKRIGEGEPVLPLQLENQTNPCQTCFCMGGVVRCRPLECDRALEGCRPITEDGHCCPDRYDCNNTNVITTETSTSKSETVITTLSTGSFTIPIASTASVMPTTTEKEELLPEPSGQKMTTSKIPATLDVPSTDGKLNSSAFRNRSVEGSREERRNKDKYDFQDRTSYEDDEKEDSSSISYEEHVEHEHEPESSMPFEDTTDQSSSNSEMELDSDVSPTEENDLETRTILLKAESSELSSDEASEIPNSTGSPDSTEVQKASRQNSIGSTSSFTESTTTGRTAPPATTSSPSALTTPQEKERVTNPAVENSMRDIQVLNASSSIISGLGEDSDSDSDSDMESTSSSIVINQDVESTETSLVPTSPPTSTVSSPTTSTNPSVHSIQTTVKNVHFIPFGVEDAVVSPSNDTFPVEPPPTQNVAYGDHALKISLIPPTPPKGYVSVPLNLTNATSGAPPLNNLPSNSPVEPLTLTSGIGDDLRNAIMDVPVSTSLYSHGYYRNGIITDQSQRESLELEMSSRRPFPGQVLDDYDHYLKVGIKDAIVHPTSAQVIPDTGTQVSPSRPLSSPQPTLSNENPARTYSKFGIQDSAYYKYGYGNVARESQTSSVRPIVHHHRYYNAPEQEHLVPQTSHSDFEPVINEDDMTYTDDEDEGTSFEEQSAESPYDHVNYPNLNGESHSYQNTPPPKFVFPQISPVVTSPPTHPPKAPPTVHPNGTKTISGNSNSHPNNRDKIGFNPAVAFPFALPKRPAGSEFNLGLKLSGCNIYGKMYNIGDVIRELSSSCVRCLCTEIGVQCSEISCQSK
ncbi:unnamed protein product [Allacma fusca]|uniref:VWFC domain-containing protein n=1 Tax=Allacma fusca TaxID=39272 RepID=A0A8J2P8G4_9HEXA|nr:unnamed protein product [Allacma fusca]